MSAANKDPEKTKIKASNIPREVDIFFSAHRNEESFSLKLYEKEEKRNGKVKKRYLITYSDELISEEDIKEDWGGGEYQIISDLIDEDGNKLMKDVSVSPIWGKGRLRMDLEAKNQAAQVAIQPQQPAARDPLETLERISRIASPFIDKITEAIKGRPQTDGYESLQKVMLKGQMESINQMTGLVQKNLISQLMPPKPQKEKDTMESNFVKEIVLDAYNGIKKYLPDYIGAKGLEQKVYDRMLEKNEVYQEVVGDMENINQLYELLVNDPEIGEAKANEFVKKIGLEIDEPAPESVHIPEPITPPEPPPAPKPAATK